MTAIRSTDSAEKSGRVSRDDWLRAGLAMLIESGVDAVQITALSRRVGVTRGSFYWHFEDRAELLAAMLDAWRRGNTGVMVGALEQASSLTDGILRLFAVWVDHAQFNPKLDQAVRDWARRDNDVMAAVTEEDDNRIAVITAFFRRFGYAEPEAFIRARVIYFTQVSYYALDVEASEDWETRSGYLDAYFRAFTGRNMDEAEAKEYRKRMLTDWNH